MPATTIADTPEPRLRHSLANGVRHAHFEWRPERRGQGPSLCMVHATGFHGRVWDQVIHHLPGRHVFAVEQRGHGRSQAVDFNGWADFGHDLPTRPRPDARPGRGRLFKPVPARGAPPGDEALTRKELRILGFLESGASNREIADSLFVSEGTLKWHLHNVYRKLGCRNRSGAIAAARRQGLL